MQNTTTTTTDYNNNNNSNNNCNSKNKIKQNKKGVELSENRTIIVVS